MIPSQFMEMCNLHDCIPNKQKQSTRLLSGESYWGFGRIPAQTGTQRDQKISVSRPVQRGKQS
jgi:hypothetical protein